MITNFAGNEIMVATSCVALGKANTRLGDFRDNVGNCKHEIRIVKNNLKDKWPEFPVSKLEDYLSQMSRAPKSFC